MKKHIAALLVCALTLTACPLWAFAAEDTEEPVTTASPAAPALQGDETTDAAVPDETADTDEEEGIMPINEPMHTDAVLKQGHESYMAGFPDGTFRPDATLTRAQTAQILCRLLENPGAGQGACSYTDVKDGDWFAPSVRALCALGLVEDSNAFYPEEAMTRGDFVDILYRLSPGEATAPDAAFPDVPEALRLQINAAVAQGWIAGYPDGRFQPDKALTRAEGCTILNRLLDRSGDRTQAARLLQLGLFSDVRSSHWAAAAIVESAVTHTPRQTGTTETWGQMDLASLTFTPGFHTTVDGTLFYADRHGKLALNRRLGAYQAGADGALTQVDAAYQMPDVPYFSQIDDIYAWVGCEAVATFSGLQAKGFAKDVTLKYFLDNLPRSSSDPEKGFVGSPYVPDTTKRTRTTIYPAKLAEYTNSYCNGEVLCADFRGASIQDLQRELLAGNCVVGYLTLWWATPFYRNYVIEGKTQRLVSNNHAILVCGYDPEKGYYISDPYNYYNRGQVHQYWENAATFEKIWNERKTGMVMR